MASAEGDKFKKEESLCASGIWIRNRDGIWQAKLSRGGSFTNSRFKEVEGPEAVTEVVRNFISTNYPHKTHTETDNPSQVDNKFLNPFGLSNIAEFETLRERWRVDEGYEVVIDKTKFGWVGGEVEKVVAVEKYEEGKDGEEREVAEKVDGEMKDFMERFAWAFPVSEKVVGKMTAYFEWMRDMERNARRIL